MNCFVLKLRGFDDEGCYAEILKDDIVDLRKTLLPPTPDLLPMVPEKTEDERWCQQPEQAIPSHVLSLQGKANRRIRLRWLKHHHKFHFKPVEARARNNSSFVKEFVCPNSEQPPNCLLFTFQAKSQSDIHVFSLRCANALGSVCIYVGSTMASQKGYYTRLLIMSRGGIHIIVQGAKI